jgi:hypothetical protein
MEAEHCSKGDSKVHFVTGNYNINTFPANEWAITVLHELTAADRQHGRRLDTIEENMKKEIVAIAKLIRCEVIAVVLYTGPMVSRSTPSIGFEKSHRHQTSVFIDLSSAAVCPVQRRAAPLAAR